MKEPSTLQVCINRRLFLHFCVANLLQDFNMANAVH